jgi:hypothetical protein
VGLCFIFTTSVRVASKLFVVTAIPKYHYPELVARWALQGNDLWISAVWISIVERSFADILVLQLPV